MNSSTSPTPDNSRMAGAIIVMSAIASIAAVAMDSMASGRDAQSILQSMVQLQTSHQIVHVVAMACLGGQMFGFSVLSQRLGLQRSSVLAGLIAYGFGTMLMLLATIIDGFISTDVAAMFVGKSPEAVKAAYWMIQAATGGALIDIARVSWVCQSLAAVSWSLALIGRGGFARKAGMLGLVAGGLPAVAVVMAGSNMTEMVVVGILLLQGVWNLAAASVLLRGSGISLGQRAMPAMA